MVLKFTYWQSRSGSRIEIQKTINIFSHPNKSLGDPSGHSAPIKIKKQRNQLVYCMLLMVLATAVYTYAIGSIANIFASQGTKESLTTYKKTILDEFCRLTHIDKDIKDKIKLCLQYKDNKSLFT